MRGPQKSLFGVTGSGTGIWSAESKHSSGRYVREYNAAEQLARCVSCRAKAAVLYECTTKKASCHEDFFLVTRHPINSVVSVPWGTARNSRVSRTSVGSCGAGSLPHGLFLPPFRQDRSLLPSGISKYFEVEVEAENET